MQSGAQDEVDASAVAYTKLPEAAFKAWRGNVIRIDERAGAMPDDATLRELGLAKESAPATDTADRLVWFFTQIARFGSPLIVWSNAAARHVEFLQTIQPSATPDVPAAQRPGTRPTGPDGAGGRESAGRGAGSVRRTTG